ncbi:MAG: 4'-phosphopantetheinyl transferase family protein [Cyanobium sp.]
MLKPEPALTPRAWRIEQFPEPWLAAALAAVAPAPLLLLLDGAVPIPADVRTQLTGWLAPAERQRLAALRRPRDQQRFLLARAGLRRLLAAWCDQLPEAVRLEPGPHGKPFCPGGPPFNVSHSGDLILLGVTADPDRAVGVDLERHRPALAWQPIAARVLPERACEALAALPVEQQLPAFLQAWCRLEARLKARGWGLAGLEWLRQERSAGGVDGGDGVGVGRGDGAGRGEPEQLWDVRLPAGYQGAVVCLEVQAVPGEGPPAPRRG